MVTFACESKDIEKKLRRLHKLVVDNGGFVHEELTIASGNGGFTITVPQTVEERAQILILPKECLLPVDKFTLGLKGDDIIIKSHDKKGVSAAQAEMMEIMMALYNMTGKIRQQRETATLSLFYRDRELFDVIINAQRRQGIPFVERLVSMAEEEFYLDSFIKTRVLGYQENEEGGGKKKAAKAAKQPVKGGKHVQVLMPIIDFINHYPQAPGFMTSFRRGAKPGKKAGEKLGKKAGEKLGEADETENPAEEGVSVVAFRPFDGSDATYVNYGSYDAFDAFLHYNYVDREAKFVRSVPMQVKIPGVCMLNIMAHAGRAKYKKLPDKVKDLRFFLPNFTVDKAKKTVTLSHLSIPQEGAPRALRRVLSLAIGQLRLGLTEPQILEAVLQAEATVLRENMRNYNELVIYLNLHEPKPGTETICANAREMAKTQLAKLQLYPFLSEMRAEAAKKKARG